MGDIKLSIKKANFSKLDKHLDGLGSDEILRTRINQAVADVCDPYVPYQTGALAHNVTVDSEGITYNQPYAREQYESGFEHGKEFHPLASSYWDKVALQNHRDELNAQIRDIVNERIREL